MSKKLFCITDSAVSKTLVLRKAYTDRKYAEYDLNILKSSGKFPGAAINTMTLDEIQDACNSSEPEPNNTNDSASYFQEKLQEFIEACKQHPKDVTYSMVGDINAIRISYDGHIKTVQYVHNSTPPAGYDVTLYSGEVLPSQAQFHGLCPNTPLKGFIYHEDAKIKELEAIKNTAVSSTQNTGSSESTPVTTSPNFYESLQSFIDACKKQLDSVLYAKVDDRSTLVLLDRHVLPNESGVPVPVYAIDCTFKQSSVEADAIEVSLYPVVHNSDIPSIKGIIHSADAYAIALEEIAIDAGRKMIDLNNIVHIGNQIWTSQNLQAIEDPDNGIYVVDGETYFTWEAAKREAQKYKHLGFRLPTRDDWLNLSENVKDWGNNLKSKTEWVNGPDGTDDSGFNAKPMGYCSIDTSNGVFHEIYHKGTLAEFWASDEYSKTVGYTWHIANSTTLTFGEDTHGSNHAMTLRLVMDDYATIARKKDSIGQNE